MKKIFTCINKSYDKYGPLYITSKKQLEEMEDTYINLRCYVDDFLIAITELGTVKNKVVNYFVRIQENVIIENYENLFDVFEELKQYKNNILGLELNLSSKIKGNDFKKMVGFLQCITSKLDFRLNLGNLEVFSNEQLTILKNISNLDTKLKINQSYQGKYSENDGYDNLYTFDDLISVKEKINEIINNIPSDYNHIEKILFLYKYLGKKVHYDKKIASLNYRERESHDSKSIYDVLFNYKGVCSSIAVTFRALMDAVGIECQVVSSEEHEWNVVKINGVWYHLDLTWDLYNIKYNNELSYFLKSEKYMLKDENHQICTYYAESEEIANRSIPIKAYKKL